MNNTSVFFVVIFFVIIVLTSCTDEYTPLEPKVSILTNEMKSALEEAADKVFLKTSAPGMIAVVSVEGEGDYIIKRGFSNLTTGEPMNENHLFRIGSNTKTFTGTAVLILADRGLISLDSSISHYLPEYNIPNGKKITLRMLGNMTSGLYNYTDDDQLWISQYENNFIKSYIPDSLLALAFRHPVNFAPGTNYEYSNTNTVLLGLLIEKISGKPAGDFITENVIKPLGLKNTYWPDSPFMIGPYSHGYNSDYDLLLDATNWNPSWGYTAGVMVSTASDMKLYAKTVAEGALISENMKKERFTFIGGFYGFCIMKAGDWLGHSGSISGYNSHVLYNSKRKITLVVYVNMDSDHPVEYFSSEFRTLLN